MTPIKLLIAEDHDLARNGLSLSLSQQGSFQIVGEAGNGEEALGLIPETRPDVVLMDIMMPVMDGIDATRSIKEQFPQVKVVMITSVIEGEEVYASLAAGADAYCLKDIKLERLFQVIEMVCEGAMWLDPQIARKVMVALPGASLGRNRYKLDKSPGYNADLTSRELDVLKLLVKGNQNKEIADILSITTSTVKVHVGNIIQKLAVDDRTQAAVKALREGIINSSEIQPENNM